VWHGSADGLEEVGAGSLVSNADWYGQSNQYSAYFGWSVSTAGDVNGDGYADVVIGAPWDTYNDAGEGITFVYYGDGGKGAPLALR
jgi:hypothetical protein